MSCFHGFAPARSGAFSRENQILEYVISTAGGASRLPPFTFKSIQNVNTV
jgi:hypothetical protein